MHDEREPLRVYLYQCGDRYHADETKAVYRNESSARERARMEAEKESQYMIDYLTKQKIQKEKIESMRPIPRMGGWSVGDMCHTVVEMIVEE